MSYPIGSKWWKEKFEQDTPSLESLNEFLKSLKILIKNKEALLENFSWEEWERNLIRVDLEKLLDAKEFVENKIKQAR